MSSTNTITAQREPAEEQVDCDTAATQLLKKAEDLHTKPLWTQMTRLNPPLPNPKCKPHVWEYEKIRPSLLKAFRGGAEKGGHWTAINGRQEF